MTAREPSAVEVIAQGLHANDCGCSDWVTGDDDRYYGEQAAVALAALKAAGFVVATRDEIRAMSPSEQAEVIGGEVERVVLPVHEGIYLSGERTWDRVVGPWREVQP